MVRSRPAQHVIIRQWQALSLGPFLQQRLGILGLGRSRLELRRPSFLNEFPGGGEPGILVDCAYNGFAGIAKGRFPFAPTGSYLAIRHDNEFRNAKMAHGIRAGPLANKTVETRSQIALTLHPASVNQAFGDHEVQDPVTQKFEALVGQAD